MARAPSFAGVVLAAGDSTRMGRDKALLLWQGKTFLEAAIQSLQPATELVVVVGGANSETLKPITYAIGASLITNRHTDCGQFSSLQVGLQEVLNRGRDAAILTLVDRPPAKSSTVAQLRREFFDCCDKGIWAVVPEYQQKHGHPIVLGREMIEVMLRAPVNATARDVEHANQQRIKYVEVNDPHVTMNVDTPEDYARLAQ
jgi:molybdenum cofactor cytidylyltransferase